MQGHSTAHSIISFSINFSSFFFCEYCSQGAFGGRTAGEFYKKIISITAHAVLLIFHIFEKYQEKCGELYLIVRQVLARK